MQRIQRLLTLAGFLLLGACAVHENRPATAAPVQESYAYERFDDRLYTPESWPQALAADLFVPEGAGPFPGVLLIHGGGWARGERGDMTGIAETLAEAGFVVMNASYRFAPESTFPAQVQDLQVALEWLRGHADDYRLDPERVAAFGYSAGAHLAALLGLAPASEALDAPHGSPRTRVQAVVAGAAPTDLRKFKGGTLVPQFLGGDQSQVPDAYALASPVVHVTPAAPPFFLYHGGMDMLVSIDHSEDLAAELRAAGVHVELYRMRLRGHITAFLTDGGAIRRAIDFLRRELASAT